MVRHNASCLTEDRDAADDNIARQWLWTVTKHTVPVVTWYTFNPLNPAADKTGQPERRTYPKGWYTGLPIYRYKPAGLHTGLRYITDLWHVMLRNWFSGLKI